MVAPRGQMSPSVVWQPLGLELGLSSHIWSICPAGHPSDFMLVLSPLALCRISSSQFSVTKEVGDHCPLGN